MLWWAWVGYAWLTSVIDPEEGVVRLVMFVSMAALLVASLAVPDVFGDLGLTFAIAYAFLRACWLVLFFMPAHDTPMLRHSIWIGLVPSTAVGVGLLVAASFLDGSAQLALWGVGARPSTCSVRSSSAPRAGSSSRTTSPNATA